MLIDADTLRILNAFALRTRRSFFGMRQGAHRSPRRGHGVEFAEYRKYEIGDNPRYIDWNLFARSDKLYIRRYLQEESVSLFIIIDGSRSLTHPALRSKWDLATLLAAFTSYIALSAQDPVTISVLGGAHSSIFWGGKAFNSVKNFLQQSTDSLVHDSPLTIDVVEASRRLATRVQFPGVCVFISDFLYPLDTVAEALGAFRARNMEVHAIQLLGRSDIEPDPGSPGATLTDSETGEQLGLSLDPESRARYTELLQQHIDAVRNHCLSRQIKFVSMEVREPLTECGIETLTNMSLFL
jgi:uncharacterized protein (DUF58 family)